LENIFINNKFIAKIADFGSAKIIINGELLEYKNNSSLGTRIFQPPEYISE
jgi:serine/threonine protein kinase